MLKTGRRTTWNEIKVGDVFAFNGCWCILYKVSEKYAKQLASDCYERMIGMVSEDSPTAWLCWTADNNLYKLPESVQSLWKEE